MKEARAINAPPGGVVGEAQVEQDRSGSAQIIFRGDWSIHATTPGVAAVLTQLEALSGVRSLTLKAESIQRWDGTFASFLFELVKQCQARAIEVVPDGLPEGPRRLLALALAVPERKGARRESVTPPLLDRIGMSAAATWNGFAETLDFIGEAALAFFRLFTGRARLPKGQVAVIIQEAGPGALPIITLISSLVGLIFAFIGALQLKQFGATIYVANLVGIAMTREMGAVMAGVIMAGRTGAAFAAQLGTMQVNEEVDALKTLAIPPMEFLVIPRMLALITVMPLLCLYADFMGMLGGLVVSVLALDISPMMYIEQTVGAVKMNDIWVGVVKSVVFGLLVAGTGCMRGMLCGRSASAVGQAVTSAVVSGIVCIVVTDAIFSVLTDILGV